MKTLFSILVLAASTLAWSATGQNLVCYQLNKNGTLSKRGIQLYAMLKLKRTNPVQVNYSKSAVQVDNFFKKDGWHYGAGFTNPTGSNSASTSHAFAHLNFYDRADEMIEFQLQFKRRAFGQSFKREKATLVVGVDNWSTEYTPSYGYDLYCDSVAY